VAFSRESNGQIAIVVVPRLSYSLAGGALRAPLGELWEDTEVPAPARAPEFLENVLTAERVRVTPQRTLLCSEVFAAFPVALLAGGGRRRDPVAHCGGRRPPFRQARRPEAWGPAPP